MARLIPDAVLSSREQS